MYFLSFLLAKNDPHKRRGSIPSYSSPPQYRGPYNQLSEAILEWR